MKRFGCSSQEALQLSREIASSKELVFEGIFTHFAAADEGTSILPEELAATGGSITHELMACLGPRIQRLFIYDESLATRELDIPVFFEEQSKVIIGHAYKINP